MSIITKQQGETIVEVMIAVVILGSTLVAGMSISNKANNKITADNERFQAILFAKKQAEFMRATDVSVVTALPAPGTKFCFDSKDNPILVTSTCTYDYQGNRGAGNLFSTTIERITAGQDRFRITVDWVQIGTGSAQKVELVYGT